MRKMSKPKKEDAILVRFPLDEGKRLRAIAAELEITPPELVRMCVRTELARKSGDPAALETLANMFRQGIDEWVRTRVEYEIAKGKKGSGKKTA